MAGSLGAIVSHPEDQSAQEIAALHLFWIYLKKIQKQPSPKHPLLIKKKFKTFLTAGMG